MKHTRPGKFTEQLLTAAHIRYPQGLYYRDLTETAPDNFDLSVVPLLTEPVLLHLYARDLSSVLQQMVADGVSPLMPCSAIDPETDGARQIYGSIADIAVKCRKFLSPLLYLLVAEDPVDLTANAPRQALSGKKILVTRASAQASDLTRLLQEHGAKIYEIPSIEIEELENGAQEIEEILPNLQEYSWLVVTSANTVFVLDEIFSKLDRSWQTLKGLKIACIGSATAAQIAERGLAVALTPPEYQAESLADSLLSHIVEGQRILLPRARGSRDVLPKILAAHGAIVHEIHLYEARPPAESRGKLEQLLSNEILDYITFTSSSTVRNFLQMAGQAMNRIDWNRTKIACIGPITATTLREYGLLAAVQARKFTIPGLVDAIVADANSASPRQSS